MLASVFAIFTFCYTTRTIYDFTISNDLTFANIFSGICLPILWDAVPIFLMFAYHYQNLKQIDNKKNNRASIKMAKSGDYTDLSVLTSNEMSENDYDTSEIKSYTSSSRHKRKQ